MKFVIAPDKFKGSLNGFEFCDAVEEGIQQVFPDAEILKMPLADGGDGTIEVVKHYLQGQKITKTVNDPLFRPISSSYLYSDKSKIAYIEMAEASGLKLLKTDERNCMHTSSVGTGELISDALERGCKEIILGIGGSATNDAGMGVATALGFRFLDKNGKVLEPIGRNLEKINTVDRSQVNPKLANIEVKVACDVTNTLYGKNGAAFIYAAQKGASDDEVKALDRGLQNFSKVIMEAFGKDVSQFPGGGAAGGLGAGALVFLDASLTSGIDLVKSLANFDEAIQGADWIITGEGQLDAQTLSGKTIDGVIRSAREWQIPVAALCGSVDISISLQEELGLRYVNSIVQGVSTLQEAMDASYENLVLASYNFASVL